MATSSWNEYQALPVQRVALRSTEIAYRSVGSGPPLLMIHGWPLCGATFREYVARMKRNWTCIVPDLPGSGASRWDPSTENMLVDWGGTMAEFADALELERFAVLAHDSGGTIARVMAARLGDRVACMALGNTEITDHVSNMLVLLQRALSLPGAGWTLSKLVGFGPFARSQYGFGGCFDDLSLIDGDFRKACLAPLAVDATGARNAFVHLDLETTRQLEAIHREMRSPCMLVWGEDDRFFPLRRARAMLAELPAGSVLEVIPKAKLFVHEEKPDEFMALAEPFLAKHLR